MAFNHQKRADRWWETEYSNSIHSYLQYREVKCKVVYRSRSPQIHLRPFLLKHIKYISKAYNMPNVCVHLAISLMDIFMDNHDLNFDTIMLVSFACLTLAAKVEGNGSSSPRLNNIRNVISKDVTNLNFRRVEMKILKFLNFNIAIPTVAHFIEYYKEYYHCKRDFYNFEAASILKEKFDNMVLVYQSMTLESTKFIQYNPSLVAASIILTTRYKLGLVPCWTAQLRRVSGYLKKDLVECCSLLGKNVMKHRTYFSPVDNGYYYSSSSALWLPKRKRSRIELPNILATKVKTNSILSKHFEQLQY